MKFLITQVVGIEQHALIVCDAQCQKAWGVNKRPLHVFEDSCVDDDFAFLADSELEGAPEDPGTYEGGHAKPVPPVVVHNKWCFRECERANIIPLLYKDFSMRQPNYHSRRDKNVHLKPICSEDDLRFVSAITKDKK